MNVAQNIHIHHIRVNGGAQPRAALDDDTIAEYAEAMERGVTFPPIVLFYDGEWYWLADGYHRRKAALKLKRETIAAEVRQGTLRDAILHSAGANATHGLPRTNGDKRRVVLTLLNDEEWSRWSDREIARRCAVSHEFVRRLRPESSLSTVDSEAERQFVTKHGTPATMQTAKIGHSRATSDEWEALAERNENRRPESRPGLDEWVEQGDGDTDEAANPLDNIQAAVDTILRALGGSRSDPLKLYQRFAEARRQACEQGRPLSDFLYGQTEEEITEAIKKRIARAYPEIEPEKIVEDAQERILIKKAAEEAAYKAARPYGSFDETLSLFERIGLALVKHPDIQPVHERKIRNLCHQIIEAGFGLSERRKRG
jgi:hypothetical protein